MEMKKIGAKNSVKIMTFVVFLKIAFDLPFNILVFSEPRKLLIPR